MNHEVESALQRDKPWSAKEALQFYADGKHFDTADGRTRILDTGAIASNALKSLDLERLEMKGDSELAAIRARVAELERMLKPWGSGGIITGTVLAWIAAKDKEVARAIVYGKAAVDRALYPLAVEAIETANELRQPKR